MVFIWVNLGLFLSSIIVIWVVGLFLKKYLVRTNLPPEIINTIKLGIFILQLVIILVISSIIYNIDSNAILGLSALFGTAIGFALAVVVGNIVAGFYLITVRPFGIGDLIQVKGTTAVVLEIGLNYTKLLQMDKTIVAIPNKSLLDDKVINCSIKLKDIKERADQGFEIGFQSLMEDIEQIHDQQQHSNSLISEVIGGKEIVRYPFTVQLKLNALSPDIPLEIVNQRMQVLMSRWESVLGFTQKYYYNKYIFRQDMRIVLIADTPEIIIEKTPEFLEDLFITVFEEFHKEAN